MDNKPTLTTLLIPNLDKPEYHAMTKTISTFMEAREIKTITKALPALLADYELVKWRYDAEMEDNAKNKREASETRKQLSQRILELEERDKVTKQFFELYIPKKK